MMKKPATAHQVAMAHLKHAHGFAAKGNGKAGIRHAFMAIKAMQGKAIPMPEGAPGEMEPDQDVDDKAMMAQQANRINRPSAGGVY